MSDERLHVVLGATGGVGRALVAELAAQGRPVRAVSRSARSVPAGAEAFPADITDRTALARAVRGATVVHHAAQPPYTRWPQEFPAMTRAVTDAAAVVGAHLVVVDNLYGYGPVAGGYGPGTPAGPMTERTPLRATGRKGAVRAAMATELLAAHAAGRLPVALARFGDYHGPHGTGSLLGEQLFDAVLAGKPVTWLGSADHPHSVAYLPDIARALVVLADAPHAFGRAWHLPHAPAATPRELVRIVQLAAGQQHRMRVLPAVVVRAAGLVVPMARELAELAYQVQAPFVADDSAFGALVGDVPVTPHEQALAATLAWFAGRRSTTTTDAAPSVPG